MVKAKSSGHFTVGHSASKTGVFRDIRTGNTVTRVMNKRVYEEATDRAGKKIREYVRRCENKMAHDDYSHGILPLTWTTIFRLARLRFANPRRAARFRLQIVSWG